VEEVTKSISKETATLSVPNIRVLQRSWEKQEDDVRIRTMKLEMIKSLKSRFAGVKENRLLSIAMILDPRFKDKFFASNIIKTSVKEMLDEEMQKIVDEDSSLVSGEQSGSSRSSTPLPKCAKKDTLPTMYSEIIENSGASASVSLDEVECYLGEPLLDYESGNPFKWWGENNAWFPILIGTSS